MRKVALNALGLVVAAIVALGLVVLSSASEESSINVASDAYYYFKRQAVFLAAGVTLCLLVARFDYRNLRDVPFLTWTSYAVVVVLLWTVFAFPAIKGSHRWIPLGPVRLQPGELAKIMTVIATAVWLDRQGWRIELFSRGAFWPACIIGGLALPVVLAPDFGSVMVIGAAGLLIMFLSGTRVLHLIPIGLGGCALVVWKIVNNANRMARIAAFLGIQIDFAAGGRINDKAAEDAAYQGIQALIAMSRGGLWGEGLNQSLQKYSYLPEAHTDMIFAIGAEELGLIFSICVFMLFVLFFVISVYIAKHAADRFGRFLAFGMAFIIFFQAMFNIGVVCGALPMKGMALPFFSYGGTNVISSFIAIGLIFSVGLHSEREKERVLARCLRMARG